MGRCWALWASQEVSRRRALPWPGSLPCPVSRSPPTALPGTRGTATPGPGSRSAENARDARCLRAAWGGIRHSYRRRLTELEITPPPKDRIPAPGRPAKTCGMQNEKQASGRREWGTHRLGEELRLNLLGVGTLSAEGDRTTGPALMCITLGHATSTVCDLNTFSREDAGAQQAVCPPPRRRSETELG